MKVLVIQPKIGMGDMVIYLPYILAIAKKFQTSVSILVKENSRAKDLLIDDDQIKEIITLDRTSINNGSHDGISGFFKLIKELKKRKFDQVFIFSSSLRYFLISKVAGIKKISQYPLFRKKDNIVTSAKIFTENELGSIVSTQPKLCLDKRRFENLKNKFTSDFKHICVGISASGHTKRWSIENYINLCEKIDNKIPSKFYIAAGKEDIELTNKIFNSKIKESCFSFQDLKISETKKVVIATYSMASEGLDIKTLTTLVMATPLSDVEQAFKVDASGDAIKVLISPTSS